MLPSRIVKIDEAGRLMIPHEVRSRLDLQAGSSLELLVRSDSIVLRPLRPAGRRVVGRRVAADRAGRSPGHRR
ncbi:MAG: hypothetical protein KatS3mg008_1720 [Acidimicrobiales bacterium]|nr:MAG: hypothetical protein KatS3mg008_1720 [Acidimicrobiales bacterium]